MRREGREGESQKSVPMSPEKRQHAFMSHCDTDKLKCLHLEGLGLRLRQAEVFSMGEWVSLSYPGPHGHAAARVASEGHSLWPFSPLRSCSRESDAEQNVLLGPGAGVKRLYQPFLMLALWPARQRNLALSPRPKVLGPRMSKAGTPWVSRTQTGKDLPPAPWILTEKNFEGPPSWSHVPGPSLVTFLTESN